MRQGEEERGGGLPRVRGGVLDDLAAARDAEVAEPPGDTTLTVTPARPRAVVLHPLRIYRRRLGHLPRWSRRRASISPNKLILIRGSLGRKSQECRMLRRFIKGVRGEADQPNEVGNDAFAAAIEAVAANPRVRTILEIGSAWGAGIPAYCVRGIARNESKPRLFCLEAAPERFRELQDRYADAANVYCVNASSVGLEGVATEGEVSTFHTAIESTLNRYRLDDVLRWREKQTWDSSEAGACRSAAPARSAGRTESRSSTPF